MKQNSIKNTNKVFKILWRILPTIILLLTSISILTILPLRNSPYKAFIVTTGSMRPKIPEGSIVFVQRRPAKPLKANDIITFKKPNNPVDNVTHRIVKIILKNGKPIIITKGDANNSNDIWDLRKEAVWGKVVFSIPYIGYFASFAKTKIGVVILVLIPLGLITISELFTIFKEIKKLKKKKGLIDISPKMLLLILVSLNILVLNSFGIFTDTITTTLATINTKCWSNPTAVSLLSPNNNTITNNLSIDFNWLATSSSCPSATITYNFQLFNDLDLNSLNFETNFTSSLTYNFANVPEGEYWWRVQAKDQYNNISNSAIYHLVVDRTAPSLPGQIGWTSENPPVGPDYADYKTCGGAVNYSPMTNLWNPSTDINGVTYEREVYTPIDNRIYNSSLTNNYENGGGAVDGTTYWVRVRAKDAAGNYSPWTDKCSIKYDTTVPSTPSLSITGSFTKSVEEKITNGGFETGNLTGWTVAGNVSIGTTDPIDLMTVTPYEGNYMARIGNPDDSGNQVWENRLMKSFDSGAKSLSLQYNFFSREAAGADTPGFFIRLNGNEIFKQNNLGSNGIDAQFTDWKEFYYDLSPVNEPKINLALYAGNTGDNLSQSWVYIDKVTTYFVSAPAHAIYTLTGNDNPGGSDINYFRYKIDADDWATGNSFGNEPPLSSGGEHTIQYYSVDNAGNNSPISTVKVITDDKKPSTITDLAVNSPTANSVVLSWNAPYNDFDSTSSGKAASYEIRYSTSPINDANFSSATKVEKVSSPKEHNTLDPLNPDFELHQEHLEILGLNQATTYYFAIKSLDEAPNTSDISNVASGITSPGTTINAGDIIINELMWMGSNQGADDEWIELRNMTDHPIDLTNLYLEKYDNSTSTYAPMLTIPTATISAHGYFLISNFLPENSKLKNSISADLVTSDIDLDDSYLSIKLFSGSNLIDEAWDKSAPKEGIHDTTPGSEKYYSMERTSIPGDGRDPLNWYTCIDEASKSEFFDNTADERGTPKAANRSENEPFVEPTLIPLPTVELTPTVTSEPIPTVSPTPEFTPTPTLPVPTPTSTPDIENTITPTQMPELSPTEIIPPTTEPTIQPTVEPTITQTP